MSSICGIKFATCEDKGQRANPHHLHIHTPSSPKKINSSASYFPKSVFVCVEVLHLFWHLTKVFSAS